MMAWATWYYFEGRLESSVKVILKSQGRK